MTRVRTLQEPLEVFGNFQDGPVLLPRTELYATLADIREGASESVSLSARCLADGIATTLRTPLRTLEGKRLKEIQVLEDANTPEKIRLEAQYSL